MKRGLYEFKSEDALRFARELFAETKQRGNELQFKECPYCHGTGRGNEYKFSINLKTGLYKCMRGTCEAKGNFVQLAQDFGFDIGVATEYYAPKKQFRSFRKPEKPIEPKDAAIEYFAGRGISKDVIKDYEITIKRDDNNTIVFPFFSADGESIPLIKYRAIKVKANGSKEWMEANCKPVLFGMQKCHPAMKTIVITEGQIDSLSLTECGIVNAVSVPGGKNNFTWVPYCWDFMNQFDEIIVFGDFERGEISLLKELTQRFGRNHIIKHVRFEDYKDCKDANDILRKYGKDQVRKCVNRAEVAPMPMLKDLADVKAPEKVEKLKTGIKSLDTILHGGLPFGLYHVISGKRGNGKSTLASQIFAQAINQGYTCMAYSGELPDYLFKFWLDSQIAGARNIIPDPKTAGRDYEDYIISSSALNRITEWYRGKCFIYDNTVIKDENAHLLEVIDEAIRRYGVKVVLIDNLMTAIHKEEGIDNRSELERQGAFSDKLAEIAQETGALIILVAHKRKASMGGVDASDDISGTAQITNYAGVVISYDRYSNKEIKEQSYLEDCRKLGVSKNRLYGTLSANICMDFDKRSRRIFGSSDELKFKYAWETGEDPVKETFVNVGEDLDEIPFD